MRERRAVRWLAALAVWLAATALLAPACFFGVMLVAGPHSSLLPPPLQSAALLLGWAILFGVPTWLARAVWRRLGRPAGAAAAALVPTHPEVS